uniref:Uncharacterized protein n=1 Tax=Cyanothece sp. (strain PCC 7425 / ATCC 29141) TaxID=395961 RepID=B8HUZ4_CYAP4
MQRLLLLLAIGGGVYIYFNPPRAVNPLAQTGVPIAADAQAHGFMPIVAPDNAEAGKVLVIGPTCNSPNGQRTKVLMQQLAQAGIPYNQTTNINFTNPALANPQEVERLNQVMGGQAPIVILNGRGKANPTIAEVVSEFRQSSTSTRI